MSTTEQRRRAYDQEYSREYRVSVAGKRTQERRARKMRNATNRFGDPSKAGRYTDAEDAVVIRSDLTVAQKSAILCRSGYSVQARIGRLRGVGISW